MANPEHTKILGQGVDIWNRWRAENPGLRPDLSMADLCGAELLQALGPRGLPSGGASLTLRKLRWAEPDDRLDRRTACGANLRQALLHRADLSGADPSGACMVSALCASLIFGKYRM